MSISRRTHVLAAGLVLSQAAAAAPLRAQAREPASPAPVATGQGAGSPSAAGAWLAAPRKSSSHRIGTRMLIGMGVGSLAGAPLGAAYGYAQYDPCPEDCLTSRGFETVMFGIVGASAGGVLGTIAGALWPGRRPAVPAVAVAPVGRQGVRIGVTLGR